MNPCLLCSVIIYLPISFCKLSGSRNPHIFWSFSNSSEKSYGLFQLFFWHFSHVWHSLLYMLCYIFVSTLQSSFSFCLEISLRFLTEFPLYSPILSVIPPNHLVLLLLLHWNPAVHPHPRDAPLPFVLFLCFTLKGAPWCLACHWNPALSTSKVVYILEEKDEFLRKNKWNLESELKNKCFNVI